MAEEKQKSRITVEETETGFRIEVTGKSLRDVVSCCCIPVGIGSAAKQSCCEPEEPDKPEK